MKRCFDILIYQKMGIWMFFCLIFLFIPFIQGAEIPQVLQYQGRFLDAATNRPVEGVVTKQMTFSVRTVGATGAPEEVQFTHTASSVSIRDGVFNVEIPVPNSVTFDQPFGIEVVVQGSGGGNLGFQKFRTVPYAITSKNALFLGGKAADQYSLASHTHTTAGGKSFTIDGTGSGITPNESQLAIKNGDGVEIFQITDSGEIDKVNTIRASGAIETEGSFRVINSDKENVFVADQSGNVTVGGDLDVAGRSEVGSLTVSGTATLQRMVLQGQLSFGVGASIDAQPSSTSGNILGQAHSLEDHASSDFFTRLSSLVSGSVVTGSFHVHSFSASQITSTAIADGAVESLDIQDGTIGNVDIAANAEIADSKLATIVTSGKISSTALPVEVALENQDNTFGAGFSDTSKSTLQTLNEFDRLRSKTFQVTSTNSAIGSNFVEIRDLNGQFRWTLDGDGILKFIRVVTGQGEVERIKIQNNGTKTEISLRDVVFQGDSDMISGAVIQDGTILTEDLAAKAVDETKIADGAVVTAKIEDGAVTDVKIADGAVTQAKIQDGVITTDKIANDAITTTEIADGAITSDKLANGSVTSAKISDLSVNSNVLATGSVTSPKIATGAVTGDKVDDGVITGAKIADGAINNNHLDSTVLESRDIPMSISISNTTTPHITLASTIASPLFLKMESTATGLTGPGVLLTNQGSGSNLQLLSLNLDGSISMRSADFSQAVTLDPKVFAVMLGVTSATSSCLMKSAYNQVDPNDEASTYGNGFCFSDKSSLADVNFNNALLTCSQEGAGLCSISELRQACQAGEIGGTNPILSTDLTVSTTIEALTFQKVVGSGTECDEAGESVISSLPVTNTGDYACCINP